MAGWSFVRTGTVQDEVVGPIETAEELFQFFARGELKAKSQVMHPSVTGGNWVALNSLPVFRQFEAAITKLEQRKQEVKRAEDQKKQAEQKAAQIEAEQRRRDDHTRTEIAAEHQRQIEQQRHIQLSKVREIEGADRWPHLVTYAKFLDVWALIIQILVTAVLSLPGGFALFSAVLSLAALVAAGEISMLGIGMFVFFVLIGALEIALAGAIGYLVRLAIGATADFLKCVAAIESNTRRLWERPAGSFSG